MHFELVDRVVERSDDHIVTVKQVSLAEEYLQDHFPGFAVLPGVLMIEAIVQAARVLLTDRAPEGSRLVLGGVRAVKYGSFVRPGEALIVRVSVLKDLGDGVFEVKGDGTVSRGGQAQIAVAGRLTLRPARLSIPDAAA